MIRGTIQNTIQNTIRNTLGDEAFSMLDLFSGGKRGVWYDPSDLSTMFQESTGRTAVTADGQPVGLMYDKSRGELFGDELVTNGTFDSDTSGWTAINSAALSVVSGTLKVEDTTGSFGYAIQLFATEIGKTYTVSLDIVDTSNSTINFAQVGAQGDSDLYINSNIGVVPNSSWTFTFTAQTTASTIQVTGGLGIGKYTTYDNVSVKEVLGTTATQPVATKRPTYKDTPDRLEIDLVDDALLFDVPTGGIDGYMVVGTDDGTASYGVSLPEGQYELGGDYFPSTNSMSGFLLREGDVSKSDLRNIEKYFISKGAKASYGDVTSFTNYWRDKNITEFPLIDTSSGTNFSYAWALNNLISFPQLDMSSATRVDHAWRQNSLTEFPAIDFPNCTNFSYAWAFNNKLTEFPLIDTSSATNFFGTWLNNNLTEFPLIDASSVINFQSTWYGNNLTSFPLIDTSSGIIFGSAWYANNLTSFPKLDMSSATSIQAAWRQNSLTSFPAIDMPNCANFREAWRDNALTSFPLIDTSSGTDFQGAWYANNLTEFPLIDTSNGTNFIFAWYSNNLTSFPKLDFSSATRLQEAWRTNPLENFPESVFDNCLCTDFTDAFSGTNLSQTSIDNILVSIESNGTSNGTFGQSGGSAPSSVGETAIDNLRSRGWTITVTGGY